MEIGYIEFISFEEYARRVFGNSDNNSRAKKQITNDEIEEEMLKVVKYYEQSKKAGEKNGNI